MPRISKTNFWNVQKRPLISGEFSFRVRIRLTNKTPISLTFYSEEEACEWLEENYEKYKKNPDMYLHLLNKKKKWIK